VLYGLLTYPLQPAARALLSSPLSAYEVTTMIGMSVEHRNLNVHQDEIRPLTLGHQERLPAVLSFDEFVPAARQEVTEDSPVVFLIFDDENTSVHGCGVFFSCTIGNVNEKVEPSPSVDSTQMHPPCISIIRLAIDSPRPVPPFRRIDELSAC
jgi:hypothetical protein